MGEKAKNEPAVPAEQKDDLSEAQIAKCAPVAKAIMRLIVDADPPVGNIKKEDASAAYDPIRRATLQAMLDADLSVSDVAMVFALVLQPFDLAVKGADNALKMTLQQAANVLWGKPSDEVTLQEVDKLLKSKVKEKEATA